MWLIIKREYLTRVKKRSFLLSTFLTPVAFAVFFFVVGLIFSYDSGEKLRVAVFDPAEILQGKKPANESNLTFVMEQGDFTEISTNLEENEYDIAVQVPEIKNLKQQDFTFYYESTSQLGLDVQSSISRKLAERVREYARASGKPGLEEDYEALAAAIDALNVQPDPVPLLNAYADKVRNAEIYKEERFSDHAPQIMEYDLEVSV